MLADIPGVTVNDIVVPENNGLTGSAVNSVPLEIFPELSKDQDNSETLSLVITVPEDTGSPIGVIDAPSTGDITVRDLGDGVYTVNITNHPGSTPQERLALLQDYIDDGNLLFVPRDNYVGELDASANEGIAITAVSTEDDGELLGSAADDLAAGGDGNPQSEPFTAYVGVKVTGSSDAPSVSPTDAPSMSPTDGPSDFPSSAPSGSPSQGPTLSPSSSPTDLPSTSPSALPYLSLIHI